MQLRYWNTTGSTLWHHRLCWSHTISLFCEHCSQSTVSLHWSCRWLTTFLNSTASTPSGITRFWRFISWCVLYWFEVTQWWSCLNSSHETYLNTCKSTYLHFEHDHQWLLKQLNFLLCLCRFQSVTIFSAISIFTEHGVGESKSANFLRVLIWTVFQCECSAALLVDITVWTILVPTTSPKDIPNFFNLGSVSMHILNAVFLAVDLLITDIPIRFHFGCFILIPGICYVLFSWWYFAEDGEWRYFFMDPSKYQDVLWMFIVFAMHFVSWSLVWFFGHKKEQWHRRRNQQDILRRGINAEKDVFWFYTRYHTFECNVAFI